MPLVVPPNVAGNARLPAFHLVLLLMFWKETNFEKKKNHVAGSKHRQLVRISLKWWLEKTHIIILFCFDLFSTRSATSATEPLLSKLRLEFCSIQSKTHYKIYVISTKQSRWLFSVNDWTGQIDLCRWREKRHDMTSSNKVGLHMKSCVICHV